MQSNLNSFPNLIHSKTVILAPTQSVWAVLGDYHGVDNWSQLVEKVVPLGEKLEGIGAGRRCYLGKLGIIDEYVTVWRRERSLGYRVSKLGPIVASESLWQLSKHGVENSEVSLSLSYKLGYWPIANILHAIAIRPILQTKLVGALALLKTHVEGV